MKAKYKIVADTLESEIRSGVYSESKKIPTEEEIGERFGVSRNTTRKAIDLLVQKGWVYQVQGSGVFVREMTEGTVVNLQNMNGLTEDFPDKKIETKVIDFKLIEANQDIADKMQCKLGTPIYFVNRLRVIDDETYSIEYSYFNKDLILYLNDEIIKKSIYNYIREDLKLTIGLVDRIFYADYVSDTDAKLLGVEKNAPAIINENKTRLANGEIFDYSRAVLNYKNVKFTLLSNLK